MVGSFVFLLLSTSLLSLSTAGFCLSNLSPPPRSTVSSPPPPTPRSTLSSRPLLTPRATVSLPPPPPHTVSSPPQPTPRSTVSSPPQPPPISTLSLPPPPPPRSTLSLSPQAPPPYTVSWPPQPEYSILSSMVRSFLGKMVLGIFASGLVLYLLFPACRRFLVDLFEYVTEIANTFPILSQRLPSPSPS